MKKQYRHLLPLNIFVLALSIITIITTTSSTSTSLKTEKVSLIEILNKTSNDTNDVFENIPVEVIEKQPEKKAEEVKIETKVIEKKASTQTKKKEIKKEEKKEQTPAPRYDKFGKEVGSISISNSSFKKDLVSDDTSYYYLDHTLNNKLDYIGVPFIDYRTDFNGRKTIIYSHSSKKGNGQFNYLQNYNGNKSFFENHQYITINYNGKTYKYQIFSVYISIANDDYDEGLEYYRVMDYTDDEWEKKINEYKKNSDYETGVSVSKEDKILILQTCSMDNRYYKKYYRYNQLVMAKLISIQ